jgi:hypothetical protein
LFEKSLSDILPVLGSRPNVKSNMAVITLININGTKTNIHEIIPKPRLHKIFNNSVNIIMIQNLKNAILKSPLNKSIIICVSEKHIYIKAGGHKLSIKAIYIIYGKKEIYNIYL